MRNFITNHGLVMVQILLGGETTVSEIASRVGIKEQAAYVIVRELVDEGFIRSEPVGRRNTYWVNWARTFNRPALGDLKVADIVNSLAALAAAMRPAKSAVLLHLAEIKLAEKNLTKEELAKEPPIVERLAREVAIPEDEVRDALDELERNEIVSRGPLDRYTINRELIPEPDRPLTIGEQVRLVLETNPPFPDLRDIVTRDLAYLDLLGSPTEREA